MNAVGRTLHGILGVWHGLAAIQNVFEILAARDVVPGLKPLASKNLELIGKLLEPLHPGEATIVMLLAGASAVEVTASVAYLRGLVADECADAGFAPDGVFLEPIDAVYMSEQLAYVGFRGAVKT